LEHPKGDVIMRERVWSTDMGEMPLSLRLAEETVEALKNEAQLQNVEPDEVAQEAIQSYLDFRSREREIMRERIAEADKGVFISEEAMTRWIESWGTENELPPPEPDIFPPSRA
jgi:predicted transcriptional regulator